MIIIIIDLMPIIKIQTKRFDIYYYFGNDLVVDVLKSTVHLIPFKYIQCQPDSNDIHYIVGFIEALYLEGVTIFGRQNKLSR